MYIPTRSERFWDARKDTRKSTDEVAKATGVSGSVINALENKDDHGADCNSVAALAKYYGVSADYLLCVTNAEDMDRSVQAIARYTMLSNKSVERLAHSTTPITHRCLDRLLSADGMEKLLYAMDNIGKAVQSAKFAIENAKESGLDSGNTGIALQLQQNRLETSIWQSQKVFTDICYELFQIKETEEELLTARKIREIEEALMLARKEANDGEHSKD